MLFSVAPLYIGSKRVSHYICFNSFLLYTSKSQQSCDLTNTSHAPKPTPVCHHLTLATLQIKNSNFENKSI